MGGCQYRGGYHDACGGYLEYRMFSTMEGYHDKCGGYLEYRGDIMSTMEDTQYRGGYHDARGDIMSTVEGKIFCY